MSISHEHFGNIFDAAQAAEERMQDRIAAGAYWRSDGVEPRDMGNTQKPKSKFFDRNSNTTYKVLFPGASVSTDTQILAEVAPDLDDSNVVDIRIKDILERNKLNAQIANLVAKHYVGIDYFNEVSFNEVRGEIVPSYTGVNAPIIHE